MYVLTATEATAERRAATCRDRTDRAVIRAARAGGNSFNVVAGAAAVAVSADRQIEREREAAGRAFVLPLTDRSRRIDRRRSIRLHETVERRSGKRSRRPSRSPRPRARHSSAEMPPPENSIVAAAITARDETLFGIGRSEAARVDSRVELSLPLTRSKWRRLVGWLMPDYVPDKPDVGGH